MEPTLGTVLAEDVLTNLRELIAAYSGDDAGSINLLDHLAELGLTSLDHIQLIMDVEDAFGIEIPEQDTGNIRTVAALYDAILRAQGLTLD